MLFSRFGKDLISLPLGLGFVLLAGGVALAQEEPRLINTERALALQIAAEQNQAPVDQLAIVASAKANYAYSGKTVKAFKVENRVTGETYQVNMDASGAVYDGADLIAAEQAAYATRFGRLEPALAKRVAGAAPKQTIPVIVWLNEPEYRGPARPPLADQQSSLREAAGSEAEVEAYFAQADAMRAAAVAPLVAPVARELGVRGYHVKTDAYAPMVAGALRVETIRDLAQRDEVAMIYLDRVNNKPQLENARATIHADIVERRGYTGAGVSLAQVEVGGRIATSNPFLSGVTQDTTNICNSTNSHSTGVAGIIRSTDLARRGIAPGAQLWAGGSCAGRDSELTDRTTAAADWGARAINLSWGGNDGLVPGVQERFYDNLVLNRWRTIVVAAGNHGATGCPQGSSGNVLTPGLGYNTITVGNFNDNNSTTWSDDFMDRCSSWRNPTSTHSDREKPEVAAPGTNINSTTTASPWTGAIGSGTSFAAPMVTSMAGLLIQRNWRLQTWPEVLKAIIMASAVHNIEGSARLSEFDGAGGVVADIADNIADSFNGKWDGQIYDCSAVSPLILARPWLPSGVGFRMVIAWDNDPAYSNYASQPSADLDLEILDPNGYVVGRSASYDNTYEIVDTRLSTAGYYTVQVKKWRCDLSPRYLGWAWYVGA